MFSTNLGCSICDFGCTYKNWVFCVKVCFKVGNDSTEAFEKLVTSFWGADSGKETSF
jgi:hypothetical protein